MRFPMVHIIVQTIGKILKEFKETESYIIRLVHLHSTRSTSNIAIVNENVGENPNEFSSRRSQHTY